VRTEDNAAFKLSLILLGAVKTGIPCDVETRVVILPKQAKNNKAIGK
jgi:hypothetical protein